MKVQTLIKPRRDGTVRVSVNGSDYVFKQDDEGILSAEMDDEHAKTLLLNPNFVFDDTSEDEKRPSKISFVSPKNKQKFPAEKEVIVQIAGIEDVEIDRVDYLLNDDLVNSSDTAPYSVELDLVDPGSYELTAQAFKDEKIIQECAVVFSVNKPKAAKQ